MFRLLSASLIHDGITQSCIRSLLYNDQGRPLCSRSSCLGWETDLPKVIGLGRSQGTYRAPSGRGTQLSVGGGVEAANQYVMGNQEEDHGNFLFHGENCL